MKLEDITVGMRVTTPIDPAVVLAVFPFDPYTEQVSVRHDSGLFSRLAPNEVEEVVEGMEGLMQLMGKLGPSSLAARLDRYRPYDGQEHTAEGWRGQQEVRGVTVRDVVDCFVRACFDSSGLPPSQWPGSVYDLPWDQMDIMAVSQNLCCWIEKYMGIFPNLPVVEGEG